MVVAKEGESYGGYGDDPVQKGVSIATSILDNATLSISCCGLVVVWLQRIEHGVVGRLCSLSVAGVSANKVSGLTLVFAIEELLQLKSRLDPSLS